MRAGRLRHRVTIEEKIVSQNSYGEEVITWSDVATVWAAVEDLSGREFLEAQRAGAEVTTRIRIRYRAGVVPEMQVVHGSSIYDVQAVLDGEGRRRELHLMSRRLE